MLMKSGFQEVSAPITTQKKNDTEKSPNPHASPFPPGANSQKKQNQKNPSPRVIVSKAKVNDGIPMDWDFFFLNVFFWKK